MGVKRGYSLIELLVVLAVIVLISLSSLPNIFGRNERLSLDTSANRIRQLLIDARTRSLAPTGRDGEALGQVFQVSFSDFRLPEPTDPAYTVAGTTQTRLARLERGSSRCDENTAQSGFTEIHQLELPRSVYIASFFPVRRSLTDTAAVVRFSVGKVGFSCGMSDSPTINSTDFNDLTFAGRIVGNLGESRARYLVITLSAQRLAEKRYVFIDRQTSEIGVSRSNPQAYFLPSKDELAPKWRDIEPAQFNLSLRCGTNAPSTITLSYPRAEDRVFDQNNTDPNLAVFYDMSWNINGERSLSDGQLIYRPLAIRYFYDTRPGFETVRYQFETTAVSVAHQRFNVTVNVVAADQSGQGQEPYQDGAADAALRQRQKTFFLNCGNGSVGGGATQVDPEIINEGCNPPPQARRLERSGRYADARLFTRSRLAAPPVQGDGCNANQAPV